MMKKRIFTLLSALLLCIVTVIPVLAESAAPRLVDNADILSESEENTLISKLDEISERQRVDVIIVTVDTIGEKSPMEYADDFYDYNGYGFGEKKDGVLLLINMEGRDWYITTTGYGITAFTDAGREYIADKFLEDLSDGNYAEAFMTYANLCDKFITQAKTGEPYDSGNLPKKPFNFLVCAIVSLVIGLLVALVVTGIMKSKLKGVRFQQGAGSYIKEGSMNVTESRDLFLYTHLDMKEKPRDNDSGTHTSSSGTTHGGGGGTF
ncbi:MAG: TPM domain-containing protein [Butyrivibrio sp.]